MAVMTEKDEAKLILTSGQIDERVELLVDFLHCNGRINYWKYDADDNILYTNCERSVFNTIIKNSGVYGECRDTIIRTRKPAISSINFGMTWAMVGEFDGEDQLTALHVFGPAFNVPPTQESIDAYVSNPKIRASWRPKFERYIKEIPVITATAFIKDALMLQFAMDGRHLKPSDISITHADHYDMDVDPSAHSKSNYAADWARDNAMMELIRNGDIYYKEKIPRADSILQGQAPYSDKELPRARQGAIMFAGLCIRAAIDGGISPDTAYTKGNAILAAIDTSKNFPEILSLTHSIFEDFIFMVHNLHDSVKYSDEIRACVDYISTHPEEPLDIAYLAPKIGYADYYLSRKFKNEVGMSINSYIKKARIDRACYLLVTTDMDIQEISDGLHFGDRSFFSKVFKKETGTTPAEFRAGHRRTL